MEVKASIQEVCQPKSGDFKEKQVDKDKVARREEIAKLRKL